MMNDFDSWVREKSGVSCGLWKYNESLINCAILLKAMWAINSNEELGYRIGQRTNNTYYVRESCRVQNFSGLKGKSSLRAALEYIYNNRGGK